MKTKEKLLKTLEKTNEMLKAVKLRERKARTLGKKLEKKASKLTLNDFEFLNNFVTIYTKRLNDVEKRNKLIDLLEKKFEVVR